MTAFVSGKRAPRRLPIVMLICFFVALTFFGGASRADVPTQILVRLAAIVIMATVLLTTSVEERRFVRLPFYMLVGLAVVMAVQLIPLPPALWTSLPERDMFAELAGLVGMPQPWRPLSLTPDLTINSFLSLLVPAAALLAAAWLPRSGWGYLLIAILVLTAVSAILGLAQITGRMDALYFYEITNRGVAVGLFANRNHQALLLALNLPILVTLALFPAEEAASRVRGWIAAIWALFLLPLVLVTGSRAGLALYVLALLLSWLLYLRLRAQAGGVATAVPPRGRERRKVLRLVAAYPAWWMAGGFALMGAITLALSRGEAVRRFTEQGVGDELRLRIFAHVLDLAWKYFPTGAGFGAFPDVYRIFEPVGMLDPEYVNHAHNDLLEFVVDGGLPAVTLLLIFLAWLAVRSRVAWAKRVKPSRRDALARLGSVIVVLMLAASVLDYPLRTPIMMAMFAFGCAFLCIDPAPAPAARSRENAAA